MNMKKIFNNILFSALTITAVASCVADDRNNFLPDDSFGFNRTEQEAVVTWPIYGGSYDFALIKSGKGFSEADVKVSGSEFDLVRYNETRDESVKEYLPVSKTIYNFNGAQECVVHFGVEDVTKTVTVNWDVAKVDEAMSDVENYNYAIPLGISSPDLLVNEGREFLILNLVKSSINVETDYLTRTILWDTPAPVTEDMDVTIRIDNALPTMDINVDLEIASDLIASYNEANGTNYAAAPEGLITFSDPVLAAGKSYVTYPVTMNTAVLFEDGAIVPWEDHDGYLIPVRIASTSVERLGMQNEVTYIAIKGMWPVPPQLFNRNWGLYATSSENAWQTYLGVGDVRNITMDDEYIYVPQAAGGDPVLKAISIADPANVIDVNVQGVSGGTHTLSCVRMIPNEDSAVNGGKDILVASSLETGGNNIYYYVWLDGISNAPTKYAVSTAGRRLGDRFQVHGVWGNGEIYLKDYAKGAIIRHGMTAAEGIGEWYGGGPNGWARGAMNYHTSDDYVSCIGDAYIYPGTSGLGSGIPPYLFVTSTAYGRFYAQTAAGANTFQLSADLGLQLTHGYNFFSYNGKNYISYVALDESCAKGSVRVIADPAGTPEGLLSALQAQEVIMDLPLQAELDASVVSPYPSTHSTGDCVVREVNGKVYMAAMIQNVGLSLFEIDPDYSHAE